jgi:hypothetical protein
MLVVTVTGMGATTYAYAWSVNRTPDAETSNTLTISSLDADTTIACIVTGSSGGGDLYVPPSNTTTPTEISVTFSGAKIKAEKQTDGTWLVVLPAGSDAAVVDLTALKLSFTLPAGATISPANGSAQDFSKGPVTYTVTAENKTTTVKIVVAVKVESPAPRERQYFSTTPDLCEIGYVTNADGSVTVDLRIPLASGANAADPTKIEAIRATLTGVTPLGTTSYAYADARGDLVPITTKSARSALVPPPYLQITFGAGSLNAAKAGELEEIAYWLKDDPAEYVQTYAAPLSFSKIAFSNETPAPQDPPDEPASPEEPDNPAGPDDPDKPDEPNDPATGKNSGGGCDATGAGIFALCLPPLTRVGRKRKAI